MKDCQTIETAAAIPLPEGVRLAMDDIAGTMREGLLAMAVSAGLGVMTALMEEPVTAVCGPKGRDQPDRRAVRHGSEHGSVALGGRRVPVRRPRVRAADGSGELPVPAYELFSSADLLGAMAMERMLAKLSCRRCPIGLEPVGAEVTARARSTPKSPASRRFVKATECALAELLGRDLPGLDLVALMAGRVHFGDHLRVVALGIGIDGVKHPLAVVEGATENTTTVTDLPAGLPDRGLDTAQTRPGARGAVRRVRSGVGVRRWLAARGASAGARDGRRLDLRRRGRHRRRPRAHRPGRGGRTVPLPGRPALLRGQFAAVLRPGRHRTAYPAGTHLPPVSSKGTRRPARRPPSQQHRRDQSVLHSAPERRDTRTRQPPPGTSGHLFDYVNRQKNHKADRRSAANLSLNQCRGALASPANSASVHPFSRPVCDSSPTRYARPRPRTAAFPNLPPTRANSSSNDSGHAACASPACTRASSTAPSTHRSWGTRTIKSRGHAT